MNMLSSNKKIKHTNVTYVLHLCVFFVKKISIK